MVLPQGFFGTSADILMDLVLVAFIIILPALIFSWSKVRNKDYSTHKKTQVILAVILAVAVALFEVNLKLSGGIFELTKESSYAETTVLNSWIYSHTLAAVSTTLIWIGLIFVSLRRFDNPPQPNHFSSKHRFWGRAGMITMMFTGLSSFPLYYYGFVM